MHRILVANRGEIACRIIRAARALGKETVAVYSEADAGALHTTIADIALPLGPAPSAQSYLHTDRLLQAARAGGADSVHPGYGFLSESAEFAQAATDAGLTWIGPSSHSIAKMGDKDRARSLARACAVPVLSGSERIDAVDEAELAQVAARIGYPLLVKAVAGGGGIGMRRVDRPEQLLSSVAHAQAIALKTFGDGGVYLERFVPRARHIEIQVFGFGDGHAIHLFERDCSVQRRFQKVIEESPAPGLPAAVLQRMALAAVSLAQAQRYAGPGTVEFLVDVQSFEFFFLEMNTRIQVEHGVTEMLTHADLVQMQIRQAEGTLAPMSQSDVGRSGAVIECRIYAENPARRFLPSPGVLAALLLPAPTAGLRVDTGVREGDRISPYYDAMIAKLIVRADTREAAIRDMLGALAQTRVEGIHTNLAFLQAILGHARFRAGDLDTAFVDRELAQLVQEQDTPARSAAA